MLGQHRESGAVQAAAKRLRRPLVLKIDDWQVHSVAEERREARAGWAQAGNHARISVASKSALQAGASSVMHTLLAGRLASQPGWG